MPHRHPTGLIIREMTVAYMFRLTLNPRHNATTETGESLRIAVMLNDEAVIYRQEPQHLLVGACLRTVRWKSFFNEKRGGNLDDFLLLRVAHDDGAGMLGRKIK